MENNTINKIKRQKINCKNICNTNDKSIRIPYTPRRKKPTMQKKNYFKFNHWLFSNCFTTYVPDTNLSAENIATMKITEGDSIPVRESNNKRNRKVYSKVDSNR